PSHSELTMALGDVNLTVRTAGIIRVLGVPLDPHLAFTDLVADKCRTSYLHIRMLSVTRSRLSVEHSTLLANALIISRINYCCILLSSCTQRDQGKNTTHSQPCCQDRVARIPS